MTIVRRREDGSLFPTLRNDLLEWFDMEGVRDDSYLDLSPERSSKIYARVPATNIIEKDDQYDIHLAAPGLNKKDFRVDIEKDILQIRVEKKADPKEAETGFTRREFDFTAFCRSFALPNTVNVDKIKAEYIDGVLQIHLPKLPAQKKSTKKITIS